MQKYNRQFFSKININKIMYVKIVNKTWKKLKFTLFIFLQGCQVDSSMFLYYNIGDADKVEFSVDGNDVVGTYTSDDGARYVLH